MATDDVGQGQRSALSLQKCPVSSALDDKQVNRVEVTSGEHVQNQEELGLW